MESIMMSATVLAKQLQAELKRRKAALAHDKTVYAKEFAAWKKALIAWAKQHIPERIEKLSQAQVNERRRWEKGAIPGDVWAGAPLPPVPPEDGVIRDIQASLRYMAVTGQAKIRVQPSDMKKWFGEAELRDD